jgi:chemotaxis protein MotB
MHVMAAKNQPIIIIKKKGGDHAGHNGGAWKVAYADFVTALMALFIVLWLMNSSDQVKKAVAGYFNDPKGTGKLLGTTMSGTGESVTAANGESMQKLKDKLEQEIKGQKELEKLSNQIQISVTSEGLRIEMMEDKNGTFYQSGSAALSPNGQKLLSMLAAELKTLPNALLIEGHTDAAPYSTDTNYSNWELSADRANSARRLLQQDGVRANQVTQVRGYADQLLRVKDNPYDPSNRRVSILVKNNNGSAPNLPTTQAVNGPSGMADQKTAANKAASPSGPPPQPAQTKPAVAPTLMNKLTGLIPKAKK